MAGTGRVGNLTKDQEAKLAQLKESLKDVLKDKHTDHHLLRFLRARNFNLKKTEEMFREVFEKHWVGGVIGSDKEGHMVVINPIGHVDPRGFLYSVTADDAHRLGMYIAQEQYNRLKSNSKKQGRYVEGMTLIMDLEGLTAEYLWRPGIRMFTDLASILEQHYPETIRTIYVVRAPAIFPVAYNLIKPFLQENTRKKIQVLKSGTWEKVLLEKIDASVLPKHWGGTRVDPDGNPKCPSILKLGGKVPESMYVKNYFKDEENLTKLSIPAGGTKCLKYEVRWPNSAIRYQFKTNEGEIMFAIEYRRNPNNKKDVDVIFPQQKMFCNITPADGEVDASRLGIYLIKFENPAKMTAKTLSYSIEVLEVDGEEADKL
ncbi:SEC14-like protein 2 [Holothuria leucospilota]|uniref:SEC14-like protein 2 n=1 Tax=Holothuria leucospilota TaxID=206669 RepID=A0A9Q1CDI6_HOLLE|nr:SEC14-like protein 2 [Holothuria leucospilota]